MSPFTIENIYFRNTILTYYNGKGHQHYHNKFSFIFFIFLRFQLTSDLSEKLSEDILQGKKLIFVCSVYLLKVKLIRPLSMVVIY